MPEPFRSRLAAAIAQRGPLCAGIDPSPSVLAQWGLEDSAAGATEFALRCLEVFGPEVAVIKANAAFFEQYGSAGVAGLEVLISAARDAGVLTIADAKRGDIESTNVAYARAWLGEGALGADACTVSPYLGPRALTPFFDAAQESGRGVFVVVRSSNREGRDVQRCQTEDARSLEEAMLEEIAARPEVVGAVIGLLAGASPLPLPPESFYLVPGLWTQGATLLDLSAQLGGIGSSPVVVNLSRTLAGAGPETMAIRAELARAKSEIGSVLRPASD